MDAEEIWRAKPDEELIEASQRLSEFTLQGEGIIRAELRRRGLPDPPSPVDYCWKCGRAVYAGAEGDACVSCGEPYPEAVRARLGDSDASLEPAVVYRSRFAHEIELVARQLEDAGIVAAQGVSTTAAGDVALRTLDAAALPRDTLFRSHYTVTVAEADAARAREIIEGLPVSHDDDGQRAEAEEPRLLEEPEGPAGAGGFEQPEEPGLPEELEGPGLAGDSGQAEDQEPPDSTDPDPSA